MRYRVTHSTRYGYEEAIPLSHNVVRMRPREHETQTCLQYQLLVLPVAHGEKRRVRLFRKSCHVVQPAGAAHGPANCRAKRSSSPPLGAVRRHSGTVLGAGPADSDYRARPGNIGRPRIRF